MNERQLLAEAVVIVSAAIIGAVVGGLVSYWGQGQIEEARWQKDRVGSILMLSRVMLQTARVLKHAGALHEGVWLPVTPLLTTETARFLHSIGNTRLQTLIHDTDALIRNYNTLAEYSNQARLAQLGHMNSVVSDYVEGVQMALITVGEELRVQMLGEASRMDEESKDIRMRFLLLAVLVTLLFVGAIAAGYLVDATHDFNDAAWMAVAFVSGIAAGVVGAAIWLWR